MTALWTWLELQDALSLDASEAAGPDITGISIDTRSLQAGDLFIALNGNPGGRFHTSHISQHDGHEFIQQAESAGAVAVLVHQPVSSNLPQLVVEDTLDAMWELARAARRRFQGRVFAITGSSGKTTAKTFLSSALGLAIPSGSLNNFWGVPLSLIRTARDSRFAVFELGTNHPGEIAPLSKLVQPDVALLLNVYPAHVEYFQNLNELRLEKLSIAQGLVESGTLVLPGDLDMSGVDTSMPRMTFGATSGDDVQLLGYNSQLNRASIRCLDRSFDARVPGGGYHRAVTLTATAACLAAAATTEKKIKQPKAKQTNPLRRRSVRASFAGKFSAELDRLKNLSDDLVPRGRGSRQLIEGIVVIDDSYNANPASMGAALESLGREEGAGRRFAILGDMLELGETEAVAHRELADHCGGLAGVYCVGERMTKLYEALPPEQRLGHVAGKSGDISVSELEPWLEQLQAGDCILIKGSNRIFWACDFVADLGEAILRIKKTRRGGPPGKFH